MFMKRGYDLFFEMLHPPSTMEVIHGLLLPRIGALGFCTQHVLMHDPVTPLNIKTSSILHTWTVEREGREIGKYLERWSCPSLNHQAHSPPQSICLLIHLPYFSGLHSHEIGTFPWHQYHPPAQQALDPPHWAAPSWPAWEINCICQIDCPFIFELKHNTINIFLSFFFFFGCATQ